MKQLLWKEWMEQRVLLICCAPAVVALLCFMQWLDCTGSLIRAAAPAVWIFAGIIAGCGLFTTESTSGTLLFLSVLPIHRAQAWLAKLTVGGGGMLVVTAVVTPIWEQIQFYATFSQHARPTMNDYLPDLGQGFAHALLGFAIGLAVSLLNDRVVTSLIASILSGLLTNLSAYGLAETYTVGRTPMAPTIYLALILLSTVVFLATSYRTAVFGDTLRPSRRFQIAGPILLAWAMVASIAVKYGAPLLWP